MGKRYLYTIQIDSETPEKSFYNVSDLVDYLDDALFTNGIYTKNMITNYFLKRNKKISKLVSGFYKFKREDLEDLIQKRRQSSRETACRSREKREQRRENR